LQSDEGQARGESSGAGGEPPGSVSPFPAARARPFGETANPAEYVPREATERALGALEGAVRGRRVAALTAGPGLGKSLLLQILARRLSSGFTCLLLPYASLSLQELSAWALGLLGEEVGDDPQSQFLHFVRRSAAEGRVLALLIDDCGSMPVETARSLGVLARESLPLRTEPGRTGNRLRVVVAADDDGSAKEVLAALHPAVAEVHLRAPMTRVETQRYLEARLEQAGVSGARRARFDDDSISWIHEVSGGVPRLVHHLACSVLDDVPAEVGCAWQDDGWLDSLPAAAGTDAEAGREYDSNEPLVGVEMLEVPPPQFDDSLPDVGEGDLLDQEALELPEVRLADEDDLRDLGRVGELDPGADLGRSVPAAGEGADDDSVRDLAAADRAPSGPDFEPASAPADDDTVPVLAAADRAPAGPDSEPAEVPADDTVPDFGPSSPQAEAAGADADASPDDEDLDLLLRSIL
jgi:type II secretory pathway predicted ATPase ExeA